MQAAMKEKEQEVRKVFTLDRHDSRHAIGIDAHLTNQLLSIKPRIVASRPGSTLLPQPATDKAH